MGNTDEDISKYAAFQAAACASVPVAVFMRRDEGGPSNHRRAAPKAVRVHPCACDWRRRFGGRTVARTSTVA